MPPLVHLLAPQIMAKAREIEAALGPPQVGYLAQQNVQAPAGGAVHPGRAMLNGIGVMQKSGDPIAQKVAKAFLAGVEGKLVGTQGGAYKAPQAGRAVHPKTGAPVAPMLMPFPNGEPPIGMNERGEAVYADPVATPAAPRARGKQKVQLKAGEAVGIDELGESVDRKGKKLGYLSKKTENGAPMGAVMGPGRELPTNDLARRPHDAPMDKRDVFGAGALQRLYAPHLKAMQDHFQDTGREEFPPGYFNGMSPTQRDDIEKGVKALREMERGTPT